MSSTYYDLFGLFFKDPRTTFKHEKLLKNRTGPVDYFLDGHVNHTYVDFDTFRVTYSQIKQHRL